MFGKKCRRLFQSIIGAILKPLPNQFIWEWLDEHVIVPVIVGSRYPGPLDTGHMPQWRGLLEKYKDRRVHFFTLCKSARIGGTLFFGICLILDKIVRWPGPIGWMDPTGKTAKRVSRQEIQPFIQKCRAAAALIIEDKKHWTTLEMILRSCTLSILGAGSNNDLGGRQWELVIINEQDRIPNRAADAPPPSEEAKARSSQFEDTRKIVRNSTPTREGCLTWIEYLAGSQENCYLPCPECGGYQRLSFFKEAGDSEKWMRIDGEILAGRYVDPILLGHEIPKGDRHGKPLSPDSQRGTYSQIIPDPNRPGTYLVKGIPSTGRIWWPPSTQDKTSKRWDVDAVAGEARYECAFCEAKIRPEQLPWMNDRYAWRSHNPAAPRDHVSALLSALYSPFQSWGAVAKEYLLSIGNALKLHAFWNLVLGLPFVSMPTKLTKKAIELLQKESPDYDRQFPFDPDSKLVLPIRPVIITMHVDVQQTEFWWSMRAWGVDGSRYLIAWGSCNAFDELVNLSNRVWTFDHGPDAPAEARFEEFVTYVGIIDSGYKAKRSGGVYAFVHEQGGRWHCSKGGAYRGLEKPINDDSTVEFNYQGDVVTIGLIHYNDFLISEQLSRFVMKERRPPLYALPRQVDDDLVRHLTSPHLVKKTAQDGRTESRWEFECDPHLYDCEKEGEVLGHVFTPAVLAQLRAKQDSDRAELLDRLTADTPAQ